MIGPHRNQGGESSTINPVGEYVARLTDAGLRPFVVVIGEGGHAAQLSDAGALVAFAIDWWRAAPAYNSEAPATDAGQRWQTIRDMIPIEIRARREDIFLIILNEPDRSRAPYVFSFMLHIAQLANEDGYKVCGPNWSAGTPEVDAWETPEGLAWLRYCGENPDMARVAAHEYSLDTDDIRTGYPWLVGRFQFVQDVCTDHGIPQPKWLICEAGWSYESMPEPAEALRQITEPAESGPSIVDLYDGMEAALWTLGAWSSGPDLPPKLAAFMPLLTDWIVANVEPDNGDEPMPTLAELIWSAGLASKRISHNPQASLGAAIRADEYWPLGPEADVSAGDISYRLQLGKFPEGDTRRVYFVKVPKWGEVFYTDNGIDIHTWGDDSGPVVWLDVPYLSQWTPDADASSGDCGPATVAMIANYYGHAVTVNQAAIACGQPPGSKVTFISQLQKGLDHYGIKHEFVQPASLDYLRQQLRDGNPAILLIHYGSLVGNQDTFTGGHFFVTVGYGTDDNGDYFLVNDSNFWGNRIEEGNHRRIAAVVLAQAMDDAVKDGNHARQVIVATGKVQAPDPPAPTIDLRRFKIAHPDCWRVVKHVDGNGHETNEDVQDMQLGNGLFVRRKNQNGEWHIVDSELFWLVHDTSPSPGSDGVGRVYTLYKHGIPGAPKSLIQQRIGELWLESGKHLVQFRARGDCRELSENSGESQNRSVITRYETDYTFNRYGQNLRFDEVVWEQTGAETQIYGRVDGKSCGWIGWSAPWGDSEPVEVYWDRGRMTQEPDRVCVW